jgi:hypothetical protein
MRLLEMAAPMANRLLLQVPIACLPTIGAPKAYALTRTAHLLQFAVAAKISTSPRQC